MERVRRLKINSNEFLSQLGNSLDTALLRIEANLKIQMEKNELTILYGLGQKDFTTKIVYKEGEPTATISVTSKSKKLVFTEQYTLQDVLEPQSLGNFVTQCVQALGLDNTIVPKPVSYNVQDYLLALLERGEQAIFNWKGVQCSQLCFQTDVGYSVVSKCGFASKAQFTIQYHYDQEKVERDNKRLSSKKHHLIRLDKIKFSLPKWHDSFFRMIARQGTVGIFIPNGEPVMLALTMAARD